jgi:cytochrome c-type biogenesis protein CcmH/NrfG
MKNYKPLSIKSDKPKRPKRLKYVVGGLILICLVAFIFARDPAAARMAKASESLPTNEREQYLLNLSAASLRTDSAQIALAQFYLSQENYATAAQAYHDGSTKLRDEAAFNYAEAGKYDKAIVLYKNLSKNGENKEYTYLLAKSYINNKEVKEGCELKDKLGDGEDAKNLQRLCDLVEKETLTRQEFYELNTIGAYTALEEQLAKRTQKTAEDWLLLIRIYQKRGELSRARDSVKTALEQLPYDKQLQIARDSLQ